MINVFLFKINLYSNLYFIIIAISTFLSYGILSIRVSSDIPIQSSYLPLISLFFIMNIVFSFVAFGWFVLVHNFRTKNYMPLFILKTFKRFKNLEQFLFNKSKKNKSQPKNSAKTEEIEEFCDKKEIKSFESDLQSEISSLNFIAFILIFLVMLFSYVYIILSICFKFR